MEILRKVKCSDRLPNISDNVRNIHVCYKLPKGYENTEHIMSNEKIDIDYWISNIEYWYEPIDIELDSEEIYPVENRVDTNYDINKFFTINERILARNAVLATKALESSELKNIELQQKYNDIKKLYEEQIKESNEIIDDLKITANTLIPQLTHFKDTFSKVVQRCKMLQYRVNELENIIAITESKKMN